MIRNDRRLNADLSNKPIELSSNEGWELEAFRQNMLSSFHIPLQKRIFLIASPIGILIYAMAAWQDPCIQNMTLLGMTFLMSAFWFTSIMLGQRISLNASVYLFALPVIFLETVELLMVKGSEISTILGSITVCIYMALYSRRHIWRGGIMMTASIVLSELYKGLYAQGILQLWPLKEVDSAERMVVQMAFGLITGALSIIILLKFRGIQNELLNNVHERSQRHERIVTAVDSVEPLIKHASARVLDIAASFVAQASQQASATAQVSTTMSEMERVAKDAAEAAVNIHHRLAVMEQNVQTGMEQLKKVQAGFKAAVDSIAGTQARLNALTEEVGQVGTILLYNREIGEHIKVLSVNASIEAAVVGSLGVGFEAVARELRDLIQGIDSNLDKSAAILVTVKNGTQRSAQDLNKGAEELAFHFETMNQTAALLEQIAHRFTSNVDAIGQIAASSREQEAGVVQITTAMDQLRISAEQLKDASSDLHITADEIQRSREEIHKALHL